MEMRDKLSKEILGGLIMGTSRFREGMVDYNGLKNVFLEKQFSLKNKGKLETCKYCVKIFLR